MRSFQSLNIHEQGISKGCETKNLQETLKGRLFSRQ